MLQAFWGFQLINAILEMKRKGGINQNTLSLWN